MDLKIQGPQEADFLYYNKNLKFKVLFKMEIKDYIQLNQKAIFLDEYTEKFAEIFRDFNLKSA